VDGTIRRPHTSKTPTGASTLITLHGAELVNAWKEYGKHTQL